MQAPTPPLPQMTEEERESIRKFISLKEFFDKHKEGSNILRYRFGMLYFHGRGTPKDDKKAYALIAQASEDIVPDAKVQRGIMLLKGWGCEKNYQEAWEWLKGSEHRTALFYKAEMFDNGWGVVKDENQATSLYKLSAENGYVPAQHLLGMRYLKAKDESEASVWLLRAAKETHAESQYQLALLLIKSPEPVKQSNARNWFKDAAEQEHEGARKWLKENTPKSVHFSLGEKRPRDRSREAVDPRTNNTMSQKIAK